MSTWSNINLQNSASPIMEQMIFFHDHIMIIIMMITILIVYFMSFLMKNNKINQFITNNQNLETIWTVAPSFFLIFIGFPSLQLLYLIDEINNPLITLKTLGHQWFWSYEYSDFNDINFDSYMAPTSEKSNLFRLLDVDNRIVLPMNMNIRMLISSDDVIHSWTIPSLALKMDAVPGRINQMTLLMNRPGIFFGQCSEICGTNHSFMPIVLESINMNFFMKWIKTFNL
uniref:cytochrome c oxidase subunit II n=1 Tax=Oxyethira ecornuta TaxID=1401674 RepID=UPI0022DCDD0A|nr:cytochrome c oxidase subunit II [Oxyethira ecornuta]UZZ44236.1 cytochrome c oxidase subunit II [Oxyethira ecornuta]